MIGMIFKAIFEVVKWIMRMVVGVILWVAPRLFALLFSASLISTIGLNVGLDKTAERLSDVWTEQGDNAGLPMSGNQSVRTTMKVVAYLIMIVGWLVIGSIIYLAFSLAFNR